MGYLENGGRYPYIVDYGHTYGSCTEKFRTWLEQIQRYLHRDFFMFCQENDVKEGDVVTFSVDLNGVNTSLNGSGRAKYRVKPSDNAVTRRPRIYCSETYILRRKYGGPEPELLLANEEWLIVEKVEEAFRTICQARGWGIGVRPYLAEVEQEDGFKSMALATTAKDGEDNEHQILCLVTNGLIMLDAEAKLTPVPLNKSLLRVADCVFRLDIGEKGLKALVRA